MNKTTVSINFILSPPLINRLLKALSSRPVKIETWIQLRVLLHVNHVCKRDNQCQKRMQTIEQIRLVSVHTLRCSLTCFADGWKRWWWTERAWWSLILLTWIVYLPFSLLFIGLLFFFASAKTKIQRGEVLEKRKKGGGVSLSSYPSFLFFSLFSLPLSFVCHFSCSVHHDIWTLNYQGRFIQQQIVNACLGGNILCNM